MFLTLQLVVKSKNVIKFIYLPDINQTEVPACICADLKWCNAVYSTAMLPLLWIPMCSRTLMVVSVVVYCLWAADSVPLKRQPLIHRCCHGKQTTEASLTRGAQLKSCLAALKLRDFIVTKSNLKLFSLPSWKKELLYKAYVNAGISQSPFSQALTLV